jgi:oligopeptide/dipeptide ABC transporter ATP-binding protein
MMEMQPGEELLSVRGLRVEYPVRLGAFRTYGTVSALNEVSLDIRAGETLAVVGESGCGKTTLARTILGLATPTAGEFAFMGRRFDPVSADLDYRRNVQMVFQDPFDSLNPRKSVYRTLAQPLKIHGVVAPGDVRAEIVRLLETVGLSPGEMYLDRFPHQFSGGQRQRLGIARALSIRPRLIVLDEAVSALDISIRAQILALLGKLQRELRIAYLFITHDLGVVRSVCDRVAVMYLGEIVETGTVDEVFERPAHPYTRALLAASPIPDPKRGRARPHEALTGEVPSALHPPAGCRFHTRCPLAMRICEHTAPAFRNLTPSHSAACHFAGVEAPSPEEQ